MKLDAHHVTKHVDSDNDAVVRWRPLSHFFQGQHRGRRGQWSGRCNDRQRRQGHRVTDLQIVGVLQRQGDVL